MQTNVGMVEQKVGCVTSPANTFDSMCADVDKDRYKYKQVIEEQTYLKVGYVSDNKATFDRQKISKLFY